MQQTTQASALAAYPGPDRRESERRAAVTANAVVREKKFADHAAEDKATLTGEEPTRFCPGCGSVGSIPTKYRDCCPDGGDARLIPKRLAEQCHQLFQMALRKAVDIPAAPAAVLASIKQGGKK